MVCVVPNTVVLLAEVTWLLNMQFEDKLRGRQMSTAMAFCLSKL